MSAVHFSASGLDETSATVIAAYTYDLAGNRHTLARANGITTTYAYDGLNRLLTLSNTKNNSIVSSYAYILDNGGRRTSVTDQTDATTSYTYDNDNRLTGESSTVVGNVVYGYDNVGNRLTKAVNGSTAQSFTYDADDRVLNSGYSYDANGNVLSDGSHTYKWDWENKLTNSDFSTGNQVNYTYNADGLRVQQTNSVSTTIYTIDSDSGYGNVVEERDQNSKLLARYDYGDDILRLDRNSGVYYYIYDGLGSTRQLADSSGNTDNSDSYDAFGNLLPGSSNSIFNDFLFNGQQQDPDGLYYLRARYMDPARGEFESQDPVEQNLNKYTYSSDDPVDRVDPGGRDDSIAEVNTGEVGTAIVAAGEAGLEAQALSTEVSLVPEAEEIALAAEVEESAELGAELQTSTDLIVREISLTDNPNNFPTNLLITFKDEQCLQKVTTEWTTAYRIYRPNGTVLGTYWSRQPPIFGEQEFRDRLGVNHDMNDSLPNSRVVIVRLPPGTTIYEGTPKGQWDGDDWLSGDDGTQIVFPDTTPLLAAPVMGDFPYLDWLGDEALSPDIDPGVDLL